MDSITLLSLMVPLGIGFVVVSLLWPQEERTRTTLPLRFFLGYGMGIGVSSGLYFLWRVIVGPVAVSFFLTEATVLAGLSIWYGRSLRRHPPGAPRAPFFRISGTSKFLVLPAALVFLMGVFNYVFLALQHPHGTWDAWAIWNMRARFLFYLNHEPLAAAFPAPIAWSHLDYPLLLPGIIARTWQAGGVASTIVPTLVAAFFTLASVGVLFGALVVLRGNAAGLLAGMLLAGTPAFVMYGAFQLADIPLSYYVLATMVFLRCNSRRQKNHPGLLVLAGLAAGFAAWTKNEGILFLAIFCFAHVITTARKEGWTGYWRQLRFLLLGLAPVLAMFGYFKINLAPANDVVNATTLAAVFSKIVQPGRWWYIARALGIEIFTFGGWAFSVTAPLLLYGWWTRKNILPVADRAAAMSWQVPVLMLAGYFAVYLISPHDLSWHIGSSVNRLMLQIWPSSLFIFFLTVQIPESLFPRVVPPRS